VDPRIRFERHIRRSRATQIRTFSKFIKNDEEEAQFSLLRIGELVADVVIRNDGELADYHSKIDKFIPRIDAFKREKIDQTSEIARSLAALGALGKRSTCQKISDMSAKTGTIKVRRYNTNRALKAVPEFARRYDGKNEKLLSYSLTDRGKCAIQLLELLEKL